jgi:8-oxo-dGTP diphosphatase
VSVHVVGGAVFAAGRCLVAQRSAVMSAPNKWEFPGGKVEPGETPAEALVRELFEELAIEVRVGERLGRGRASSGRLVIVLDVYAVELLSGTPTPREHASVRWLRAEELAALDWADADVPIVGEVAARLRAEASASRS